jgi:hypothetical protein
LPNSAEPAVSQNYRTIDGLAVVRTLESLELRIQARFPTGNLRHVCQQLTILARDTSQRAAALTKPNLYIRFGVGIVFLLGLAAGGYGATHVHMESGDMNGPLIVSTLESLVNLMLLVGAAVFTLITLEARFKQRTALRALHELRSIIHVIDMHQLTKDPSMIGETTSGVGPSHNLSKFELVRYLDYCSEMLSLAAKLAALYAQDISDVGVVDAASDIEQLATNLSQKVWQKISILQNSNSRQSSKMAHQGA